MSVCRVASDTFSHSSIVMSAVNCTAALSATWTYPVDPSNSIDGSPLPSAPACPSVTPPDIVPGFAPTRSAAIAPVVSPSSQYATGASPITA